MTDVDFDSVASQLLKDMGVQDTETLNYFQRKPHSTEWKTSIKVPSPPKARRTKSSGTTYTRQAPKEVPQQNGSGVRRHSVQDKLLRSPQRHSSANGGPAQTSSKQTGGPGGKFGYGSSATEASGKQVPTVASPTKRVIARPAPKPPVQTAGPSAKRLEYSKVPPALKHTTSAGALVNGSHVTMTTKSHIPTSSKGPTSTTTGPSFHGLESTDGSRISKLTSPSKTQAKEPLRRIASNPDRTERQRTTTEVVQTKPASFQVLSTSSHRILHTSEDGGNSKRKPSLKTGFYTTTEAHPVPRRPQPVKALRPSRYPAMPSALAVTQPKETQSVSDAHNTSGTYDKLSPPLSPVEPPVRKNSKPSELQSLSGTYDRLSPIEIAAIRQISQEANASQSQPKPSDQPVNRQSSTTSNSSEGSQPPPNQDNKPQPTQPQPQSKSPSHKASNLPVTSSKSSTKDSKQHRRTHSSEEKNLRFSTSSQKPAPKTVNPKPERSMQSPSSSSTTTLSSPEPLSDRQTPDSDERRARLDNMSWSRQSLDKDLNTVANSTVQALSTLIEVLTPDPASKQAQFRYDTPPLNPNWYAETDDSDTSSYPLSPLSPEFTLTSSSEATTSPRGKSPLTTSVSDSSISSMNKSEARVVQRVRFADNPVEIVSTSSRKSASKTVPVTKETSLRVKSPAFSKETNKASEKSEAHSSKSSGPQQQTKSSPQQEVRSKRQEEVGSSHTSVPTGGQKFKQPERAEVSTGTKENGLSNGMDSISHDYAVIDPKFHDYAILDPEYHSEFFGYCQRCTKPVIGMDSGCFALDCVYHLQCFTCSKCSTPLSGLNFYTADDQILCETDYWSLLETCHLCSLRIRDRVLRALDRSYHPDCFRCSTCSVCLDGVPYISDASDMVYCIPDYHQKYAPRCDVCDKPILPEQGKSRSLRVRAMDRSYHIECYKCESCGKQLASKSGSGEKCYPVEDHLFCKLCSFKYTSQTHTTKSRVPRPVVSTSLL